MKTQKVLITDSESRIERMLSDGYTIVSVTAQHISIGTGSYAAKGEFLIVFEK